MAQEAVTKPYADYNWYKNEYGGDLLTSSTFTRHAKWASNLVDAITHGNIDSEDKVVDCVKDAVCAAAEISYNFYRSTVSSSEGRGKTSESRV